MHTTCVTPLEAARRYDNWLKVMFDVPSRCNHAFIVFELQPPS